MLSLTNERMLICPEEAALKALDALLVLSNDHFWPIAAFPLQNVGGVITHNTTASSSPGFPYLCGSWLEKLKLSPSLN